MMAAQEQALSTSVVKSKIFNLPISSLCRLCGAVDESVDHLVSSSYIAQSHYKKHHNVVASYIHWMLPRNAGFSVTEKWWKHIPEHTLKSSDCKILVWDFTIYTGSQFTPGAWSPRYYCCAQILSFKNLFD